VAVPGIAGAAECDKGAVERRHFGEIVFDVAGAAQQAEAPAGIVPAFVEVEQRGQDLVGAVGVDPPVARAAAAAHRDHQRAMGEIKPELRAERARDLGATDFIDEAPERGSGPDIVDGKEAGLRKARKSRADGRPGARRQHVRHDQVIERRPRQRRAVERIEIEQRHGWPLHGAN
jgi:hypothetical protein